MDFLYRHVCQRGVGLLLAVTGEKEGRKSVFTQTANRLGNRRGEEVSRLCVCLLQLPAQKEKKPRIRFQSSTTVWSTSKHGKDGDHTSFTVKLRGGKRSEAEIAGNVQKKTK